MNNDLICFSDIIFNTCSSLQTERELEKIRKESESSKNNETKLQVKNAFKAGRKKLKVVVLKCIYLCPDEAFLEESY